MNWFASSVRSLGRVVWKWRWTYAVPIATLVLPATIYALRLPATYDVAAVMQINEKNSGAAGRIVGPTARDESSFDLINKTRDRLLAAENVEAIVPILAPDADPKDPGVLQELAERIEWSRMGDNSFRATIVDTDGVRATQAVNALFERFLETEKRPYIQEAAQKHEFQKTHRKQAETDYGVAHEALDTFYRDRPGAGGLQLEVQRLEAELAGARTTSLALQQSLSAQRTEVFQIEEELARGATSLDDVKARPIAPREQALLDRLKGEQEALTNARAEHARFRANGKTEKHHMVRAARAQMDQFAAVVAASQTELDALRAQEDATWRQGVSGERESLLQQRRDRLAIGRRRTAELEKAIADQATKETQLFERLRGAPMVQQEAKPYMDRLELAHKTLSEARAAEVEAEARHRFTVEAPASVVTPYQLVQPAVKPVQPTGPSRKKFLLLGLAAGFLLGYGVMLLRRRYEDSTVVSARDVAAMLPGALVVEVPRLEEGPLIPARSVARDVVFGSWVLGCLAVTAMALATHAGSLDAPAWLARLLARGA